MSALAQQRPLAGGFTRRGACPALSAPMQTGDGLLVRLNPVAGGLSPDMLARLCDAARTHGNGVMEVTARGSIQIRGLSETSAARLAADVDRIGIEVRTGVPVQTGILAGIDPAEIADPSALADAIRKGIADAGLEPRLGPKVSVVVDGGGRSALAEVAADVRLSATGTGWQVAIAGDARTAQVIGLAQDGRKACAVTLALLAAIAERGRAARARDLDDESLPVLAAARDSLLIDTLPLIGCFGIRGEGTALGVALPFGNATAERLKAFAQAAQALGIEDIRPAPTRLLVAICPSIGAAERLGDQAAALGFITSGDDPRQAISACPGAPDCASGQIAARSIAAEIASTHGALLDGSVHLHVSGCAKGCAHPGAATLTIVGLPEAIGLVVGGTARDEAAAVAESDAAVAESDAAGRAFANLAATVAAQGRQGETTAQALERIGLPALAEAFGRRGE